MKKYEIALLIGILWTVVFGILAGFGGGACHCNTPLRVLFPYMSMTGVHAESDLGTLLLVLQCPVYALSVAMPKSLEWRLGVLLIVLVVHSCAVAFALQMSG